MTLGPLPADPRRQAVPSIRGAVYQAFRSIEAWLQLNREEQVIYVEGAEDFDVRREDNTVTVQVRNTTGTLSLATQLARDALANFWRLSQAMYPAAVEFHYLTTSRAVAEPGAPLGELIGLEAWVAARTHTPAAVELVRYLQTQIAEGSPLHEFLATAPPERVQERLFRPVSWLTDQPSLDMVRNSLDRRIAAMLRAQRRSSEMAEAVRKFLESRYWEIVTQPRDEDRRLTLEGRREIFERATSVWTSLGLQGLPDVIEVPDVRHEFLRLVMTEVPAPPTPTLARPAFIARLGELIDQRRGALITGSVFMGKSTLTQIVAAATATPAWWVPLAEQSARQVGFLLAALADRLDHPDAPPLVILDDFDGRPAELRVTRASLEMLCHKARVNGKALIVTARGDAGNVEELARVGRFARLDVPAMDQAELSALCVEHGCPPVRAQPWALFISVRTGGHPKLVQVQIAELSRTGWPAPTLDEVVVPSSAVQSERRLARQLLRDSVTPPTAELVYLISESYGSIDRAVAIRLGESVADLRNPGDVLDSLSGTWIEQIPDARYRATPLLSNAAADAWSEDFRRRAHVRIFEALNAKTPLTPMEAGALVWHAYVSKDQRRLALIAGQFQVLESADAQEQVDRSLLWLPQIAYGPGERIAEDPVAAGTLRSLQFRVAVTVQSETLASICDRWQEEISATEPGEWKQLWERLYVMSVGANEHPHVPIRSRLRAAVYTYSMPAEEQAFLKNQAGIPDDGQMPRDATASQILMMLSTIAVNDLRSLEEWIAFLDADSTPERLRTEFDSMIEWPRIQTTGAFVHRTWVTGHEDKSRDWAPYLECYERLYAYALKRGSARFGREVARAYAIIAAELLPDAKPAAKQWLDRAEHDFGLSALLLEQRVNFAFACGIDAEAIETWKQLTNQYPDSISDPFAYRRVAISAARTGRWAQAAEFFLGGVQHTNEERLPAIGFGLVVDAAHMEEQQGNLVSAARLLKLAVNQHLPALAMQDGQPHWEAVQRLALNVVQRVWAKMFTHERARALRFGIASDPGLASNAGSPGQAERSAMVKAAVFRLTVALEGPSEDSMERAQALPTLPAWLPVRGEIAFARLTLALDGVGSMIDSLIELNALFNEVGPDAGVNSRVPPEHLGGLTIAALLCAGREASRCAARMLEESAGRLGTDAALTRIVQELQLGLDGSGQDADRHYESASTSPAVRTGAALNRLRRSWDLRDTLTLQQQILSSVAHHASSPIEAVFSPSIARVLRAYWRQVTGNRELAANLERDGLTIGRVLTTVASTLGVKLIADIMRLA